jgi:hypothetical protein
MKAKQDRSNAYWLDRLEKEHPTHFAILKAGGYRSVTEALIAAGLRKAPKPINALRRAWKSSSPKERYEFIRWGAAELTGKPASAPKSKDIVDRSSRLTAYALRMIVVILANRNITSAAAISEMGLSRHDYTFPAAITSRTAVRPELAEALEKWIEANKAYW